MANKIAIVLGATGLVGKSLVNQLSTCPQFKKVHAITRRPVNFPMANVENHVIDFENMSASNNAFQGDILFSCLGTTKKQAGSIDAQRRVDVDYQLEAAKLAANNAVKQYVLVSSSGANAKNPNPYLKMKGELEEQVKKLSFERISIFQPSLLLGSRPETRLGEKVGGVVLPALCRLPGLKKFRPISGQQVAKKMIAVSMEAGPSLSYFRLDEIF